MVYQVSITYTIDALRKNCKEGEVYSRVQPERRWHGFDLNLLHTHSGHQVYKGTTGRNVTLILLTRTLLDINHTIFSIHV